MKKNYCAIINWGLTPFCNFKCIYCNAKFSNFPFLNMIQSTKLGRYVINRNWDKQHRIGGIKTWQRKIDVQKILTALEQFDKPVKVRLLGGEPFLFPDFIELAQALTQKHYIDVETNLSTNTVKKFCNCVNPLKVEKIRAAFHIGEYEKRNIVERYINNALYCKKKKFNIQCFAIAYPPYINKYLEYKEQFSKQGIKLKAQPFVGHYRGLSYPQAYTSKEIQKLDLKESEFHNFEITKGRPCTAGNSFFVVSTIWPGSGEVNPCYQIKTKLGTIEDGFMISKDLTICPYKRCYCDPKFFERKLFDKTIDANSDHTQLVGLIEGKHKKCKMMI